MDSENSSMAASVAQSNRQVLTKVGELHDMDLLCEN